MSFNNSIALAAQYTPALDAVYKAAARTSILDTANSDLRWINAATVMVPKMELQGLGSYSRNNGFVDGDATVSWETLTLTQDRGRGFQVDVMDNEETMNVAFGRLAGEFIRNYVAPEIDAYAFAKMYSEVDTVNNLDATTLSSGAATVAAIDAATVTLDDEEVPFENRILFVSPAIYGYLKSGITRMVMNRDDNVNYNIDMYNDMRVITVPQARFQSAIDLYDGTTPGEEDGGYVPDAGAKNIQFMIVHPSAIRKIAKHVAPRVFAPNENIRADAYAYQYRIYHDLFVLDNKVHGIYVSTEA